VIFLRRLKTETSYRIVEKARSYNKFGRGKPVDEAERECLGRVAIDAKYHASGMTQVYGFRGIESFFKLRGYASENGEGPLEDVHGPWGWGGLLRQKNEK